MSDQLIDRLVKTTPVPLGEQHLHFIGIGWARTRGVWAVRGKGTTLCGTDRCVTVKVEVYDSHVCTNACGIGLGHYDG